VGKRGAPGGVRATTVVLRPLVDFGDAVCFALIDLMLLFPGLRDMPFGHSMVHWAQAIGPNTTRLFERIVADKPHPEMGYRGCLGISRLAGKYSAERLEAASERALLTGACRYKSVESILTNSHDRAPLSSSTAHGNAATRRISYKGVLEDAFGTAQGSGERETTADRLWAATANRHSAPHSCS